MKTVFKVAAIAAFTLVITNEFAMVPVTGGMGIGRSVMVSQNPAVSQDWNIRQNIHTIENIIDANDLSQLKIFTEYANSNYPISKSIYARLLDYAKEKRANQEIIDYLNEKMASAL
jgi:hypothetical protein